MLVGKFWSWSIKCMLIYTNQIIDMQIYDMQIYARRPKLPNEHTKFMLVKRAQMIMVHHHHFIIKFGACTGT